MKCKICGSERIVKNGKGKWGADIFVSGMQAPICQRIWAAYGMGRKDGHIVVLLWIIISDNSYDVACELFNDISLGKGVRNPAL